MERIVIEVDESTAEKWRKVPPQIKIKLEESFEKQINTLSDEIKKVNFKAFLDQLSEEAIEKGLTEEILQQLLNEA